MYFALALMTIWAPLWIVWGLLFLIFEFAALFTRKQVPDVNNNGGTLSEAVWAIIKGRGWFHRVARLIFLVFWAWLTTHFLFG